MQRAGRATIFEIRDMVGDSSCRSAIMWPTGHGTVREVYVRAVPLPFYDGLLARMRSAWEVFTGGAYPVRWPKDGDLEKALNGIE